MAVTKFQQDHWGNQFDSINAPYNSDIPYAGGESVKTIQGFPNGISKDDYINYMTSQKPDVNASSVDTDNKIRKIMEENNKFGSLLDYGLEPLKAPIRGALGTAANAYVDNQIEEDYYNETGQRLSADQILKMEGDPRNNFREVEQTTGQSHDDFEDEEEAFDSEVRSGGVPVPDPSVSPSGALSSMNKNLISGVGTSTGSLKNPELPKPPSPKEVEKKAFSDYGKSVSFDQNKIPEWYDSHSFSAGLVSFGLNLLSGNDLATSFNAASGLFMSAYGEEKRGIWAEDLRSQGYDGAEIEQWIRTGDSKVLTRPEEKRMKQIQMDMSLAQLDNLQYANSPEMRQYALDNDQFNRGLKLEELDLRRQANQISASRVNAMNARGAGSGVGSSNMVFTDDDGKVWNVAVNARGTPIINSQGIATLYDPNTGESTQRLLYNAPRVQAASQAEDTLNYMDALVKSGDLSLSGGYGVERGIGDIMGRNTTKDLTSRFSNINEAVGGQIFAQLLVESGGKRVTDNQLKAEIKRIGTLDVKQSPERNAEILDNMRGFVQKSYHSGNKTHDTLQNIDRSLPTYRQTSSSNANLPATSSESRIVNGYLYRGGDTRDPKNWTKL